MKITAGLFKNRAIATPKGSATRPTPSRLREAVFNIARHSLEGATMLDLFAGTGIMSFEALSRGAKNTLCIEKSGQALRCIEKTCELLQVKDSCQIRKGDVLLLLPKLRSTFTLIYADPPYNTSLSSQTLLLVDQFSLLEEGGYFFLEEGSPLEIPPLQHLSLKEVRQYGSTYLHIFTKVLND